MNVGCGWVTNFDGIRSYLNAIQSDDNLNGTKMIHFIQVLKLNRVAYINHRQVTIQVTLYYSTYYSK